MDRPRRDAVARLRRRPGHRLVGQAEAAVDDRRAGDRPPDPVKRSSTSDLAGSHHARASVRRSTRTPARASRALAGARSPVRESSLPAMWSWVTKTARDPSSSARATPIGPPTGSNTTTSPSAGSATAAPTKLGDVEHDRVVAHLVLPRPGDGAGALDHRVGTGRHLRCVELHVDPEPGDLARQPRDERLVRPGDRRQAAQPSRALDDRDRVPADGRHPRRLQPGRTPTDDDDGTASRRRRVPVGVLRLVPRSRLADARHERVAHVAHLAGLVAAGARPDPLGCSGAQLGDEIRVGDLRPGHLHAGATRAVLTLAEHRFGQCRVDDGPLQR